MRTTTSRFSAFVASVDPNFEARPSTLNQPRLPLGDLSVLEHRYPGVVRTLTLLWGYPELNQYFDKISGGLDPQLNLEPAAMAEVMLLFAVHQRLCPYRPAKTMDEMYGPGRFGGPWRPAGQRE